MDATKKPRSVLILTVFGLVVIPWAILGYGVLKPRLETHKLTLVSGTAGGAYFGAGEVLCNTVNKTIHGHVRLTNTGSFGSAENIRRIQEGSAEFGLAQDGLYASDRVRSLLQLYKSPFLVFARKELNLHDFKDLAGKRVYVGANESGTKRVFDIVSYQYGMTVIPAEESASFDRAAAELVAGNIDAACFLTTLAAPAVERVAQSGKVAMVPVGRAESVTFAHPYLELTTVPRAAIAGAVECPSDAVTTIASREILVCSSDLSEDVAFNVMTSIYDGLPDLAHDFPLATEISRIDPQKSFYYRLHPGAAKYYQNERFTWHGFLEMSSFLVVIFGQILAIRTLVVRFRENAIMKALEAIEKAIQEATGAPSRLSAAQIGELAQRLRQEEERAVDFYRRDKLSKDAFERIDIFLESVRAQLKGRSVSQGLAVVASNVSQEAT
jgi:TRAP transporter TAXI family solute receptor